jgi:hypothetical protein
LKHGKLRKKDGTRQTKWKVRIGCLEKRRGHIYIVFQRLVRKGREQVEPSNMKVGATHKFPRRPLSLKGGVSTCPVLECAEAAYPDIQSKAAKRNHHFSMKHVPRDVHAHILSPAILGSSPSMPD